MKKPLFLSDAVFAAFMAVVATVAVCNAYFGQRNVKLQREVDRLTREAPAAIPKPPPEPPEIRKSVTQFTKTNGVVKWVERAVVGGKEVELASGTAQTMGEALDQSTAAMQARQVNRFN